MIEVPRKNWKLRRRDTQLMISNETLEKLSDSEKDKDTKVLRKSKSFDNNKKYQNLKKKKEVDEIENKIKKPAHDRRGRRGAVYNWSSKEGKNNYTEINMLKLKCI